MASVSDELTVLRSLMRLICLAVALDVICALLFVAAMLAFIASLAVVLREIFPAVGHACGMIGR